MTHITGIRLTNWMRYRGEHEVELEPTVYAVVAEWEGNPNRSNWGGKSSLCWAIRFALAGQHPRRTEDDWITRGEQAGGVDLEWSDGTFVSRTRERGKRTELRVLYPDGQGGELEAFGAQAQQVVDERLGLSDADATNTWWLEQGEMKSFVVAEPADRRKVVARWLGLEPLQVSTKYVADRLRLLIEQDSQLGAAVAALEEQHRALLDEHAVAGDSGLDPEQVLADRVAQAEQRREQAGRDLAGDQAKLREQQEWQAVERDAETYDLLLSEVEGLEAQLAQSAAPTAPELARLKQSADETHAAHAAAMAEERAKKRLAMGQFDGTCPVGGIPCPIKDDLNAQGARNRELLAGASRAEEKARADARLAREALDAAMRRSGEDGLLRARIDERRRQLERYRPAAERLAGRPDLDEPDLERVARAQADAREADAQRARAQAALEQIRRLRVAIADKRAQREALARPVTTHREALALLTAAQRRIAERALGRSEAGANALLRESDIDLAIRIMWAREGRDLAPACAGCGAPFPSSRKVRECATCGAARGPKLDERLFVELTDESGGAYDLAGVATKLAAGAWLRAQRSSTWSVACLDEPFGALDAHNRHALAAHVANMIRGRYGFEQAFVIAHEQQVLDSLPGRIRVIAGPDGSRLEVL